MNEFVITKYYQKTYLCCIKQKTNILKKKKPTKHNFSKSDKMCATEYEPLRSSVCSCMLWGCGGVWWLGGHTDVENTTQYIWLLVIHTE